jgi:DNA modification methylase
METMANAQQLPLFPDLVRKPGKKKKKRSGTFVDNMKLPVHRWFRYSAGFSAEWVESLLGELGRDNPDMLVLDPFAGSGTTLLAADMGGIPSVGIEAHPFVVRVARAKLLWAAPINGFAQKADMVLRRARNMPPTEVEYPDLVRRCFTDEVLMRLDKLRRAWIAENDNSNASELVWLAITAILRPTSSAGTAQWQYILPNKTKKVVEEPFEAFETQILLMRTDMRMFQSRATETLATLIQGDARDCPELQDDSVDVVVTSPPYTNNYDYADATRFEMSFWGEVQSWADLHEAVRQYLIRSCSQHASKEKLVLEELLEKEAVTPIRADLSEVCRELAKERLQHGGKKHYHTMVAAYFVDMANVWRELRRVCKPEAKLCFVVGDSAPYGVYVPVDEWLGRLAVAAGFQSHRFEKLRDRNVKWKNRKHRVPLHEGRLWVNGAGG